MAGGGGGQVDLLGLNTPPVQSSNTSGGGMLLDILGLGGGESSTDPVPQARPTGELACLPSYLRFSVSRSC